MAHRAPCQVRRGADGEDGVGRADDHQPVGQHGAPGGFLHEPRLRQPIHERLIRGEEKVGLAGRLDLPGEIVGSPEIENQPRPGALLAHGGQPLQGLAQTGGGVDHDFGARAGLGSGAFPSGNGRQQQRGQRSHPPPSSSHAGLPFPEIEWRSMLGGGRIVYHRA